MALVIYGIGVDTRMNTEGNQVHAIGQLYGDQEKYKACTQTPEIY